MAEQTLNEQRAQADRDMALNELKRQRSEIAGRLASIETKIATLDGEDYLARVGDRKVSEWSTHEKAEYVERHGADAFQELLLSGR